MQILHANNENIINPINYSIIINVSTSSFDDGAKSARSTAHWSLCARLCDVVIHLARCMYM